MKLLSLASKFQICIRVLATTHYVAREKLKTLILFRKYAQTPWGWDFKHCHTFPYHFVQGEECQTKCNFQPSNNFT